MLRLSSLLPVAFALVLSSVSAEIVNFQTCEDSVDSCSISQVRVTPCPEANANAACHIRRRHRFTMSFDFTPHFDADTLVASLGWAKSENVELPLLTMDQEACNPYTIRWALKDPVSQKRCCFTIDIKVVR
uniref:Niemann-Pick type C-2h, isoform B n=1 Tax=Drosophila melanogaster TaxID=7227 RepID=Q8IMH5_DROME|nr:Niemann-Pick type C-2h, isoform B [Drosophila melanogaster]AAN14257.1 Niemann-Pick type C-2h, isoform B [Drosophila melanogaster]|eukprot:NP_733400.1 Niemann-Pick type C-2h, isoform B [Drosophila melanogaster]